MRNQDTLNWARDTASRALQWLLDDGIAASVSVTPSFCGRGDLSLAIVITEPAGGVSQFSFVWGEAPPQVVGPVVAAAFDETLLEDGSGALLLKDGGYLLLEG